MSILRDGVCKLCGKNMNQALYIMGRNPESLKLIDKLHTEFHIKQQHQQQTIMEEEERHF